MNAIGVLLLAAATATGSGFGIGKAHVGGLKIHRHHAVVEGPPPASGLIQPGAPGAPGMPGMAGAPGMAGMPGAAMGPGGGNRRFPNVRTQVFFVDPPGMRIGWQTAGGSGDRIYLPAQLTVPARYNFVQGYIYRLKLTEIPAHPGLVLYPTIEVAPSTPATDAYLTHNPIPVQFTEEDFDQVQAGNFVTKVIYLPDPKYQELAIFGVDTLVSTRLEPGVDPILEADKRGTILMISRLGGIDLEMPTPGATMMAPGSPVIMSDTVMPPGTVISGPTTYAPGNTYAPAPAASDRAPFIPTVPAEDSVIPSGPVDTAPVSPAPAEPPAAIPPSPETPQPTTPPPADEVPAPAPAGEVPAPADDGLAPPPDFPGLGDVSAPPLDEAPVPLSPGL